MKSGMVYFCFSTDFFIEEADEWRDECWEVDKSRFIENEGKNADYTYIKFGVDLSMVGEAGSS